MTRARSKSASGAMHNSPRAAVESGAPSVPVFQSVQLAGMRERLPSGSTTSNSRVPRRFIVPIIGNERPSNGCRSRTIAADFEMSRRWVV